MSDPVETIVLDLATLLSSPKYLQSTHLLERSLKDALELGGAVLRQPVIATAAAAVADGGHLRGGGRVVGQHLLYLLTLKQL